MKRKETDQPTQILKDVIKSENASIEKNLLYSPVSIEDLTGFIDEEALLPGAMEPKDFRGVLSTEHRGHYQFKPLITQEQLINLNLTSHGQPLYYSLNDEKNILTASKGANGTPVFKAELNIDGTYVFTLYDAIDRAPQPNLITNPSFEFTQTVFQDKKRCRVTPGWDLAFHVNEQGRFAEYEQSVNTHMDQLYQVTFYHAAHQASKKKVYPIEVFWDDKPLMTLQPDISQSHGYTFSVIGNRSNKSSLKFACRDEDIIRNFISNVSVLSRAQTTVPIVLAFILLGSAESSVEGAFKINVTTTPPLELSSDLPIDVMFEQSVYQTIVVTDDNVSLDPFAKINLDSIFSSLNVPEEDRVVQVVQREQDGQPTNVYEVQVSDVHQAFSPITVADVKLSFPGGDQGLTVFFKNIHIDEV